MRITDRFQALTPRQRGYIPYLLITGAVFAAYADVYQNAFVGNDFDLIVNNDLLRHWKSLPDLLGKTTIACYYRPLQALLYFFIYQIFGLSEAAFHGVNVILQAVNACLMYRLGCRIGFYPRTSFAAALLWGIHPLWVEAVGVVAGTSDLLAGFFCLTALLILLPDFAPRKIWLASLFFVFALCSKESAVVFPALVTCTLFLISQERLRPATYLVTWPLWLLATAYIIGWLLCPALNNVASYIDQNANYVDLYKNNFTNRVLTSLATLPAYLRLIIWPTDLHIDWKFPVATTVWNWQVMTGAAIVILSLLEIVWGRARLCRNKYSSEAGRGLSLTYGLLWFAAALSPYTGILKPIDGLFFSHWIYLPTIGLFLGVAQTAALWMDRLYFRKAQIIAAGLVLLATLALGARTYLQNEILHDRGSLFENILEYNPESGWTHYQLGLFYMEQGEFDKAIEQFHWMIGHSAGRPQVFQADIHWKLAMAWLHIPPQKAGTFTLDIHTLQSCRHLPEVIRELGNVLQDDPDFYWAHLTLAAIYNYQNNKQMADFHQRQAENILQKQGNKK